MSAEMQELHRLETLDGEALVAALKLIAERAGKIILAHYVEHQRGGEVGVESKADKTPVTDADKDAEAFILKALEILTPEIPVIAEEATAAGAAPSLEGPRFWLVDPLDGTREFLSGNGEFTVNIALVEGERPIAGVVHAPALAMTWAGVQGLGAPRHATFSETDKPEMAIHVRPAPAEGLTVIASRRHGSGEQLEGFLADYAIAERISAGSSLKFCLIAAGRADLYPRFGPTMEWDTAAAQAVLEAAGGSVRTLEGAPLAYRKPGFRNPFFVASGG